MILLKSRICGFKRVEAALIVTSELGRLIAALREEDRYDDALIIVAGDHGEELGDHGEDYHGTLLYDSTMRIPTIVKWPGGSPRGGSPGP